VPNTVKIAAVVLIPEDGEAVPMEDIFREKATSPYEKTMARIEKLSKEAADNGARIVTFQEFAITINESREDSLLDAYKKIADRNNIFLSITYAFFPEIGKGRNKHLLINSDGQILSNYSKRYLLGIGKYGETGVFEKGPEIIQAAETPFGRIAISTCRDMEFPSYIRQAGKLDVDIMLSPAYDWPKSMGPSSYERAIEYGFSFVRPTYNGFSYAEDYNGRILAQMDSDATTAGIMYADVPTQGIQTLYSIVGDLLGWLCVVSVGIFTAVSAWSGVNGKRTEGNGQHI
jgi:apolipoprotein N-acyltransferase